MTRRRLIASVRVFHVAALIVFVLLPATPVGAQQVAKLTASDAAAEDDFGGDVSVSGDTAVVGAWFNDDDGDRSGSAYIFERNEGGPDNWGEVVKLTASDAAATSLFGDSVFVSDDTAVVGAPWDNIRTGAAYIFERNQGGNDNWGEVIKLTASDGATNDQFARSVGVDADTVIVGAPTDDEAANAGGSAYIFDRNEGGLNNWGEVIKLTAPEPFINDQFGFSVAISADTAIVGAHLKDDGGVNSGAAYIFERNQGGSNNWGEVVKLTTSDAAVADQFGCNVAISNDTAIVGAWSNDSAGSDSGSAYIFERNQGGLNNWGQVAKLTAPDAEADDAFGNAVTISGDLAIVGSVGDGDSNPGDDIFDGSGSAYVFARNQGGPNHWGNVMKLSAFDGALEDFFGASVGISGITAISGAPGNNGQGAAYIQQVPEPSTFILTALGSLGPLAYTCRRRKHPG